MFTRVSFLFVSELSLGPAYTAPHTQVERLDGLDVTPPWRIFTVKQDSWHLSTERTLRPPCLVPRPEPKPPVAAQLLP